MANKHSFQKIHEIKWLISNKKSNVDTAEIANVSPEFVSNIKRKKFYANGVNEPTNNTNICNYKYYKKNYQCMMKAYGTTKYCAKHIIARRVELWRQQDIKITFDEYINKLECQGYCCAICKQYPKGRLLGVDHSHTTGKVRGILCRICNQYLLGQTNENIQILQNTINYIRNHNK